MAHEINNPLEAVINLLYLARHDSRNALEYLNPSRARGGPASPASPSKLWDLSATPAFPLPWIPP